MRWRSSTSAPDLDAYLSQGLLGRLLLAPLPGRRGRVLGGWSAMAYDAVAGTVVLFGGEARSGAIAGDTWAWG